MTHEPPMITAARQAWLDQVAAMTPAQKDGAIQAVLDAGFALGLVVVPKDRVQTLNQRFEDDERVLTAVPLAEYKARQMLQAAQALAQMAIGHGALEKTERRFAGARETRYRLTFIKPLEEAADAHAPVGTPT